MFDKLIKNKFYIGNIEQRVYFSNDDTIDEISKASYRYYPLTVKKNTVLFEMNNGEFADLNHLVEKLSFYNDQLKEKTDVFDALKLLKDSKIKLETYPLIGKLDDKEGYQIRYKYVDASSLKPFSEDMLQNLDNRIIVGNKEELIKELDDKVEKYNLYRLVNRDYDDDYSHLLVKMKELREKINILYIELLKHYYSVDEIAGFYKNNYVSISNFYYEYIGNKNTNYIPSLGEKIEKYDKDEFKKIYNKNIDKDLSKEQLISLFLNSYNSYKYYKEFDFLSSNNKNYKYFDNKCVVLYCMILQYCYPKNRIKKEFEYVTEEMLDDFYNKYIKYVYIDKFSTVQPMPVLNPDELYYRPKPFKSWW